MFREFLFNNIFNKINENISKTKLIFFQIGSYPSCEKFKSHEYPKVLETYKNKFHDIEYQIILIDKKYKENIKKYDLESDTKKKNIYPNFINNREYITLIEFCHFIKNFNCLTIIMEFTSILRDEHYNKNNITDYLYITPSICLEDTSNILFNPILIKNENSYNFYRLEKQDSLIPFMDNLGKNYAKELLKNRYLNINNFYRKILNYMKIEIPENISIGVDIDLNYDRNYEHINKLYNNLYYRIGLYQEAELNIFMNEFKSKNNEIDDLEIYIKKIIFNILLDCLKFKYLGNENMINENFNNIIFENDIELKKSIDYFSVLFD